MYRVCLLPGDETEIVTVTTTIMSDDVGGETTTMTHEIDEEV